MNCVSSAYVDDLMQEVVELCTKSRQTGWNRCRSRPLLHQECIGQIRHRLSRSIGATLKPRMMLSNSATLALREILHSLAMDSLLVS